MLLSNTTNAYADACPRRAPPVEGSSPTARVFSRDDFMADCAPDGACDWFHTLGVEPGEIVFFRNGEVLHGLEARVRP